MLQLQQLAFNALVQKHVGFPIHPGMACIMESFYNTYMSYGLLTTEIKDFYFRTIPKVTMCNTLLTYLETYHFEFEGRFLRLISNKGLREEFFDIKTGLIYPDAWNEPCLEFTTVLKFVKRGSKFHKPNVFRSSMHLIGDNERARAKYSEMNMKIFKCLKREYCSKYKGKG